MTIINLHKPKTARPSEDYPLMSAQEAAQKLGFSTKTLMQHVHAGRLRFINIGTEKRKAYRFTPKNLVTFIQNQKVREVPQCQSLPTRRTSTKSTSSFAASVFSAVPKPGTAGTQKH